MTKYQKHINKLCKKYDITIIYTSGDYSCDMLHSVIRIGKDIRSIKTYFSALHEISHIINESPLLHVNINKLLWTQNRNRSCIFASKFIMQAEVDAWKCAFKLAKWTNTTADRLAVLCLFTYIHAYNQCHRIPFKDIDDSYMTYVRYRNEDKLMVGLKNLLFL